MGLSCLENCRKNTGTSFKKCYITNALDEIKCDISWDNCDPDCRDLKNDLQEPEDSKCETSCKSEEPVNR
jgi:hypothetical protein